MITNTQNDTVILSKAKGVDLLSTVLLSYMGGVALVGRQFPAGTVDDTRSTAAMDSRIYDYLLVLGQVGSIDANVTVVIAVSATAGGSYTPYHSFSALDASTDDNKEVLGLIDCRNIPAETPWVRVDMTIGAGTTCLTSMMVLGVGTGQGNTAPVNVTSVDQVYSEIGTPPYYAAFTVGVQPTTPVSNISQLTLSDATGAGVQIDDWSEVYTESVISIGTHANLDFIAGASPTQETLTGVVVFDEPTGNVIWHSPLSTPAGIGAEGDAVFCELLLSQSLVEG